jgi:hypothetical protein
MYGQQLGQYNQSINQQQQAQNQNLAYLSSLANQSGQYNQTVSGQHVAPATDVISNIISGVGSLAGEVGGIIGRQGAGGGASKPGGVGQEYLSGR